MIFRVQRYDPEKDQSSHFQEFIVFWKPGDTVLDGLMYIKENLDSTLAFRSNCRMFVCGSCAMFINGYPRLACHSQIEELDSKKLTVRPLPNFPIVKDLVPALDAVFDNHRAIKPYIIRHDTEEMEDPSAEFAQLPKELNEYAQFTHCIKCGICLAACPTFASARLFSGPQALAQCYRYIADNRDEGETDRAPLVSGDHGVWQCHLAGACSESCPKGVDPALGIQLLKRRLVRRTLRIGKKARPAPVVSPPTETKPKIPVPDFNVKR
ncbi:MAG: succinate dehydrogenase iron-sulfur subunit [Chloroflexi bacterium]|nr:succinate dehydrogenase iron-sulfur subunit [Chloroflexota bacterium]